MSANLTHVLLLCDKKEKRNTAYLCFVPVLERSEKNPPLLSLRQQAGEAVTAAFSKTLEDVRTWRRRNIRSDAAFRCFSISVKSKVETPSHFNLALTSKKKRLFAPDAALHITCWLKREPWLSFSNIPFNIYEIYYELMVRFLQSLVQYPEPNTKAPWLSILALEKENKTNNLWNSRKQTITINEKQLSCLVDAWSDTYCNWLSAYQRVKHNDYRKLQSLVKHISRENPQDSFLTTVC